MTTVTRNVVVKLPATGPAREALRQKGQFWTPSWIAEAMVEYVIGNGSDSIFDPAVGEGAFFRATKTIASENGLNIKLCGTEIDSGVLKRAIGEGLVAKDISNVEITDFVINPPKCHYDAIVANPPYIRHHRIPSSVKVVLKRISSKLLGSPIDGRAGLHIYFLLRALEILNQNGRLAFIMPADTCEGVFSSKLWRWITDNYKLDAVITFKPEASPFPGVDTNPIIFMITKKSPSRRFFWIQCSKPQTEDLKKWAVSGTEYGIYEDLTIVKREISEALTTGFSRPPTHDNNTSTHLLSDFAKAMRGIATGANEFFFLTKKQAANIGLPEEFLTRAIGRTRDLSGDKITEEIIKGLDSKGRPTLLFAPDGRPMNRFPVSVIEYLKLGEERGINKKALISTRSPWYKMETRPIPPILFSYLGRRNTRFILNLANVVPLTGFLCLYPRSSDKIFINKLWQILNHDSTIANLSLVGKSYGDGAIKVEPRSLEKLPIPDALISRLDIRKPRPAEMYQTLRLFEERAKYKSVRKQPNNIKKK